MVYRRLRNQAQRSFAEPFPEHHILVHRGRLQLRLLTQVEYLECAGLCLQRDDLLRPVHDGTIRLDGSSDGIIVVLEVDDYDFGGGGIILLLADADEGVGFEGLDKTSALRMGSFHRIKYSHMS